MVYFVRKYSSAKWVDVDSLEEDNIDLISSDAYTSCLRTNNNQLSIWKISCDIKDHDKLNKELEETLLAMVTSFDTIRNAQFIYFSEDDISELKKTESKGDTPIEHLVNRHRDLEVPTIKDLKKLAKVYVNSIKNNQTKRFNRKQILEIVDKAINDKLLTRENSISIKNNEIKMKLGIIACCIKCRSEINCININNTI